MNKDQTFYKQDFIKRLSDAGIEYGKHYKLMPVQTDPTYTNCKVVLDENNFQQSQANILAIRGIIADFISKEWIQKGTHRAAYQGCHYFKFNNGQNLGNDKLQSLIRRAAGIYISEDDCHNAYTRLLAAKEAGDGALPADEIVTIWQPLEGDFTIESLVEYIETESDQLKELILKHGGKV